MLHKMTSVCSGVWICSILLFSFVTASDISLTTSDLKEQCVTKLKMCELDPNNVIAGKRGDPGQKGDKGAEGEQGPKGDKGSRGDQGLTGLNGPPGAPGASGEKGLKGDRGTNGTNGEKGLKGDTGRTGEGLPGRVGLPGAPGVAGPTGPKGAPGIPGMPGTCRCTPDDLSGISDGKISSTGTYRSGPKTDGPKDWGADDNPGLICRKAPNDTLSDTYRLNLGISVHCDMLNNRTCLNYDGKNKSLMKTYHHEKEPFWLSGQILTLKDMYDLDFEQVTYLQRQSLCANLTIKYHCYNSIPVGSGKPLMLLSWNDILVGPTATASSPFHYYVDPEKDGCSKPENKDTWSSTIIKLISPSVQRLPIVDFYISDIRDMKQELKIEIIEFCFG